jgi:hypothetical protein
MNYIFPIIIKRNKIKLRASLIIFINDHRRTHADDVNPYPFCDGILILINLISILNKCMDLRQLIYAFRSKKWI